MAGLPIGAPAKTALLNATFFIKNTISDIIKSIMILSNEDPLSGPEILNAQKEINQNTRKIIESIALINGGQITPNVFSLDQLIIVQGAGGAVVLDLIPFDSEPKNGTYLCIIGQDDINTVRINDSSVANPDFGFSLNGDAILKKGYIIELVYIKSIKRYFEKTRNF